MRFTQVHATPKELQKEEHSNNNCNKNLTTGPHLSELYHSNPGSNTAKQEHFKWCFKLPLDLSQRDPGESRHV